MRTALLALLCFCYVTFFVVAVEAEEQRRVDGVWSFDVDATIGLMLDAGDLPAPLPEVRDRLGRMRVVIDTARKMFIVTADGIEKNKNPILMVSENDGVVTLHRKTRSGDQYRWTEDGRLMGIENGVPTFMLKRVR